MTPLLEQFIAESREFLQAISTSVMALEQDPDNSDLMTELFRQVHTLKGNSGLFEFPAMTRVLHAAEDLMDAIRHGKAPFSHQVTDVLLDAMDFVSQLFDEIESHESLDASRDHAAAELAQLLRDRLPPPDTDTQDDASSDASHVAAATLSPLERLQAIVPALHSQLLRVPEAQRMELFTHAQNGEPLWWVQYQPEPECFFKGEDPLFLAMETPGLVVAGVHPRTPWPELAQLDAYRCELQLSGVSTATHAALDEHFRYIPEQVQYIELPNALMVLPSGDENGGPVYEDFVLEALATLERGDLGNLRRITHSLLEFSSPSLWLSSALRWLLLILDQCPERTRLLKGLIESIHTLNVPDWLAHEQVLWDTPDADAPDNAPDLAVEAPSVLEEAPAPTPPATDASEFALLSTLNEQRRRALQAVLHAQLCILELPADAMFAGRIKAVSTTLRGCAKTVGADETQQDILQQAVAAALASGQAEPLHLWLIDFCHACDIPLPVLEEADDEPEAHETAPTPVVAAAPVLAETLPAELDAADEPAAARPAAVARANNDESATATTTSSKTLRVEQTKIDRLMNLIGEMVVAKNALPYLASRAENQYGVRELSRDIKTQYGVINRIAEEMQDAIMQVRMMPVSFIFQRFPRLVRDLSNKLGKDVHLVLEGEDTEADKNVIEALADPLIHIVRNSLDHGLELPSVRKACGKPEKGRLQISARQESDHVTIEIIDDGKGIDPLAIKRSAYQKGLIDEDRLETMSDQEAVNLVFLPGFSTAETITDVSGRGVGMDVVRSAIQRVGGTVHLSSVLGQGTRLHLSLPLSMAVTNVMIIESARQIFGFTMDAVVETVRLPRAQIRYFKQHATTVLRERVIPLFSLNDLLALDVPQQANDQDELALLVLRLGTQQVGLLVDAFLETTDIILKPLPGVLGGLRGYSGSALLGDGSVLMVLNHKELF